MLAIVFKEIRENIVWALLILLALGASMAYVIYRSPDETLLVGDSFHLVTAMGFSAAGFVLALIQVLVDRRRGRWDFVSHRPISRTRIFFSKFVAGAALYVLACVIPLVVAVGWIAIPGNVAAPFDGHMILPRLADLFSGLVWYAAGLLVAGRQARWIGSRIMPVGLGILASVAAVGFAMNLPEAMAIFALAIAILLPAAWGAFIFGGEYEPQPLVTRLTQGIAVGAGVMMAVVVVAAMLGGILDATLGGSRRIYSVTCEVGANGQVAFSRYDTSGDQILTDLQGRRLSDAEVSKFQNWRSYTVDLWLEGLGNVPSSISSGLQSKERYRLDLRQGWAGVGHQINWSYLVNRRTIEGFDTRTRRYIGGIGPDGFVAAPALPQAFPEPLDRKDWSMTIIFGRTTAYELDLNDHKISRVFLGTSEDPILDAQGMYPSGFLPLDLVATRSAVRLFSNGRETFKLPLEHRYPPYYSLYVTQTRDGQFIFHYADGYWRSSGLQANDWIVETNTQGIVQKRTELPFPQVETGKQAWWIDVLQIVGVPPVYMWLKAIINSKMEGPHWAKALIELVGIGIVCAIAVVGLLRRRDQTRWTKIVWIVIAMLMGVSGVLLLLSLRDRVAAVRCPSCGKDRLVTREVCEHCNAPFAEPARLGIEILELV
jgi:hypothetical protein